MSEKRLSKATRKRLPRIIEGILNEENYDDIAEALGLKNRRTIERDVQAWRQSGGFEEFLTNQWMKLHGKIKEMDPVEAYRQITKLLGKTLTQKIKSEISGGEIVIKMWEPPKEDANSK